MHIVTLVANARCTTERRIMHDYTPRQITHVGDAMMRDRTFVLNMVTASLGKGGKSTSGATGDLNTIKRNQATRAAGGVGHFKQAAPGELTPGSRRYDMRGMTQGQANKQMHALGFGTASKPKG